jgi:hypothetical protein
MVIEEKHPDSHNAILPVQSDADPNPGRQAIPPAQ